MDAIFGVPLPALMGQLVVGLVNGCFYALLSLGLAVIFGLLNVVNFCHGALYMSGALLAWAGMAHLGMSYWLALLAAPLVVAAAAVAFERTLLARLYRFDHLYGLLLTFGLALLLEGAVTQAVGSSGLPYPAPELLQGGIDLGFMVLPAYRAWVVGAALLVCGATWALIERTRLGAMLRAGTENPRLLGAFGLNVPRLVTGTYAAGAALAALTGVLAAPLTQVSPHMGSNLLIVVFAVVVIGGMGSVLGAIVTGLGLGVVEGVSKVYYPPFANTVVFALMVLVLLTRPAGLFGRRA
ncbi:branched-chain amino acid ABC transporter permease [Variovorax sp. JS1663]|uniref:branched-chain amino acid ABC transporter permease n=1 Tax=Variovorax sp. JS1663 TaxID=1851577 RepID=UPI000B34265D|nr:branched-chain amino acid ABC transporter permease [Variovorax sp. JS1663]OUL99607.1 ABC transporter permease [Variovorax sp. JS1663]